MKQVLIIIVFTVILLVIISVTWLFLGRKQKEKSVSIPSQTQNYTSEYIVSHAIEFLNKQKRQDGYYDYFSHFDRLCTDRQDPSTCPLGGNNSIEEAAMWPLLARIAYYRSFSNDPSDLNHAKNDAQTLLKFCQQNMQRCLGTVIPMSMFYELTQNQDYKQFLQTLGTLLLEKRIGDDVASLSLQAVELTRLFNLFSTPRYLGRAEQLLGEAKNISLENIGQFGNDQDMCYLILGNVSVGIAAGDQELIDEALSFFEQLDENALSPQLSLRAPCIESAFVLGGVLQNSAVKNQATALLERLVLERWDGPGLGKTFGGGGFFQGEDKRVITISDTSYMVYLISYVPSSHHNFSRIEKGYYAD